MLHKNLKKDLNTLHPTSHHISLELKRYHKGKTIDYHMASFLSALTLPLH